MSAENPFEDKKVVSIGRGHEIRAERKDREKRADQVIDKFQEVVRYQRGLVGNKFLRNRFAEDTESMLEILLRRPEDMNVARAHIIRNLLQQVTGMNGIGTNNEKLVYTVGDECLREAIEMYKTNGGTIEII